MNKTLVKKFQLSNQALEIIECLFKFNSLTSQQLLLIVSDKTTQAIYQNLNKLIFKKIIFKSKYKFDNKAIYNLTLLGKKIIGIEKPSKTSTYLSIIDHNDAIIKFIKKFELKNNEYLTENVLKQKFNKIKKIPDLMILKNLNFSILNQRCAITRKTALEFEFSIKSKKRYFEIFEKYNEMLKNDHIDSVIYFCNEKLFNYFNKFKKENLLNEKIKFVLMPIKKD